MNAPTRRQGPSHSPAVIALPEPIDSTAVHTLTGQAAGAWFAGRRRLVVDLRAISAIDTPTLSELCAVLRRVCDVGMRAAVVGADFRIRWILELCEIDGLELHRTMRSAHRHGLPAPAQPALIARRGLLTRSPSV